MAVSLYTHFMGSIFMGYPTPCQPMITWGDPPPCLHGNRRLDPKLPGFQDTNIGGVQRGALNSEHPYRSLKQNIDFVEAQFRSQDTPAERPLPP